MGTLNTIWVHRVLYGNIEYYMGTSDTIYVHRVPYAWVHRVLYGYTGYYMGTSDTIWVHRQQKISTVLPQRCQIVRKTAVNCSTL